MLQFSTAELVGENTWRLSGLLRAQSGTEAEMAAGATSGTPFVLVDGSVQPLVYEPFEIGLQLDWRVGRSGNAISDPANASQVFAPGARGYKPHSPVHLHVVVDTADNAHFTWLRRDRVNADAWSDGDIPMSESEELYDVVLKSDTAVLRQWQLAIPMLEYPRAEQLSDIASFPADLLLEVAQISATHGKGAITQLPVTLE